MYQYMFTHEHDMATWWRSGAVTQTPLRTHDGRQLRILYLGRPGGSSGPDFRDAIILLNNERCTGDIELHLRLAGWHEHGHDIDPQYNRVVLHVVDQGPVPVTRQTTSAAGKSIPIVVLADQPEYADISTIEPLSAWPCQNHPVEPSLIIEWLRKAGADRFQLRQQRFINELHTFSQPERGIDYVLTAAILEAIGYGHDPAGLRLLARHMSQQSRSPLDLSQFDAISSARVRRYLTLWDSWNQVSPAAYWCGIVLGRGSWDALLSVFTHATAGAMTVRGQRQLLGATRGAIILWNAVLPSLAAYGTICGNRALVRIATQIAVTAPGLPSNNLTRHLTRWLQLPSRPAGALAQQGLHHLQQQWCQEKVCHRCPIATLHPLPSTP